MKPKNKLQREIIEKSEALTPITQAQKDHALKSHSKFVVMAYKQHHYCLDCGHVFKSNQGITTAKKGCTCPKCNTKLELLRRKNYNSHGYTETMYYALITTVEGFQVVRMYLSEKHSCKQQPSTHSIREVMRHFIDDKGNIQTTSRARLGYGYYYDKWKVDDKLEFRAKSNNSERLLYLQPYSVYPKMKMLPILRRNGFNNSTHNMTPHLLFKELLTNNRAETLFKAKQYALVEAIIYGHLDIKYINSVKIALKHGYIVKNFNDWKDYLDLLRFFGKDLSNPKYVCPQDLHREHNRYVEKKRQFDKKIKLEKLKAKIDMANKDYQRQKRKFFGLVIQDEKFTITPLRTVKEFYEESEEMRHCVFQNEYYKRANSLILSAKMNGIPVETIELSLKDFKIVQARGYHNNDTKYNKQIRLLINSNIKTIKKIAYKKAS